MRILVTAILAMSIIGCTSETEFGECIGINGEPDKGLRYEYSAWNIAMGFIFIPMIIPPIAVVLDHLKCPVGVVK